MCYAIADECKVDEVEEAFHIKNLNTPHEGAIEKTTLLLP